MTRRCLYPRDSALVRGRSWRSAERPGSGLSSLRGARREAPALSGRWRRGGGGGWSEARVRTRRRPPRRGERAAGAPGGPAGPRGAAPAFLPAPCSSQSPGAEWLPLWGSEGEPEGSQLSLCPAMLLPAPRAAGCLVLTSRPLRGAGLTPRARRPGCAPLRAARAAASTWLL